MNSLMDLQRLTVALHKVSSPNGISVAIKSPIDEEVYGKVCVARFRAGLERRFLRGGLSLALA